MTDADRIFERFPPFIQEYIYSHGWTELRKIQLEAARVLFDTDHNLLLSSSTASGKTEAAFFPVLADILSSAPAAPSVRVLYVAPLKSLINDQFYRMEEVLSRSCIPVTHWHGDVGRSHKEKLLKEPEGILQITPESLESMLMNRSNDIPRLFGGLRYVIIDEIHALIGTDRGNQVMCQLARMARLIGYHPRRIGLSATVGDVRLSADWLGAGTGRPTDAPIPERTPLKWMIGMEHFYIQNPNERQTHATAEDVASRDLGGRARLDAGYEFLYDGVYGKKALVFSNSREETEYVTATLRQIAKARGDKDVFLIHHGNLSASLREDAELRMKDESIQQAVTCATVTMELGIDIGRLERVAQVGAPTTVSSFLQRLGRSGRRGEAPQMLLVFREETPLPNAPLPELIPFDLLRGIAILDLYGEERFIEPPKVRRMPLSLAFQQTLSILASGGEMTAKVLAKRVLSLPPLSVIPKETYRELLVSMINQDYIEMTEGHGLIVGLAGERLTNSYKFYAVFKDSEDFTVRAGSEEIGTITTPPPVGDRFALAGRVWEVLEVDVPRRLIFVKAVDGKMEISWPGGTGEIHTKMLVAMRRVLFNGKTYPFLSENAKARLEDARRIAAATGMDRRLVIPLGGQSYVMFPWLGTCAFQTVRRLLKLYADELGISDIQSEWCWYITFKARDGAGAGLEERLADILRRDGIHPQSLVFSGECPVYDKYDEYLPAELLREAFAADRLCPSEVFVRFLGEIPSSDKEDDACTI
ncbi:MAG: DEAD/DEAH box helicase [Clostridia bacterium]|nr:DEAD/DEAH box helicase [Clostridia bacterium]